LTVSKKKRRRRQPRTHTPDRIAMLVAMTPPAGDHHNEAQMQMLDR
jgi:hypothetical protein